MTSVFARGNQYGVSRYWTATRRLRLTEEDDPAPARRAKYDWLYYYEPRPGILVEKSPPNAIRGRWLQQNFQPSRFIAVTRHPYAVCEGSGGASAFRSSRQRSTGWSKRAPARRRRAHGPGLARPVRGLLRAAAGAAAADAGLSGRRRPFDHELLNQPLRIQNIDGKAQPIQNMNAKSIERLSQDEIAVIDRVTAPLRERLGYGRARSR